MAIEDEMYLAFEGGIEERTRELKHAKLEADRRAEEAIRGQDEERRGREEERRRREEAEAEIARLRRLFEQQQGNSGGTG